jgi:hypothetical protein
MQTIPEQYMISGGKAGRADLLWRIIVQIQSTRKRFELDKLHFSTLVYSLLLFFFYSDLLFLHSFFLYFISSLLSSCSPKFLMIFSRPQFYFQCRLSSPFSWFWRLLISSYALLIICNAIITLLHYRYNTTITPLKHHYNITATSLKHHCKNIIRPL